MYDCKIFDLSWSRVEPAGGQLSADSVEKVGFGFHGRKVRV